MMRQEKEQKCKGAENHCLLNEFFLKRHIPGRLAHEAQGYQDKPFKEEPAPKINSFQQSTFSGPAEPRRALSNPMEGIQQSVKVIRLFTAEAYRRLAIPIPNGR